MSTNEEEAARRELEAERKADRAWVDEPLPPMWAIVDDMEAERQMADPTTLHRCQAMLKTMGMHEVSTDEYMSAKGGVKVWLKVLSERFAVVDVQIAVCPTMRGVWKYWGTLSSTELLQQNGTDAELLRALLAADQGPIMQRKSELW